MKMCSRIVFCFVLFLLVCLAAVTKTTYAYQNSLSGYSQADTAPDVPHNLHSLTQIVTMEVAATLSCQLSGFDPTRPDHQCLGMDQKTGVIGFVPSHGGLIGLTVQGIALTFNIPVHTSNYVHYLANNFGFEQTYAAAQNGVGFSSMEGLLGICTTVRNLAYLLFTIFFVILGLLIMLRKRIDPRTVMTVENQLPKIVISLICITFSFAIAGAMIDMMWVLIFFTINTFLDPTTGKKATQDLFYFAPQYFDRAWNGGIGGLTGDIIHGMSGLINSSFSNGTWGAAHLGINGQPNPNNTWDAPEGWLPYLLGVLLNVVFVGLANTIGYLIIFIAIWWMLVKLWINLLKTYIYIIFLIIFGPFYILLGLIPGSAFGFVLWIKHLAAHLAVYVVVIGEFVIAIVINNSNGSLPAFPLLDQPDAVTAKMLIVFGILFVVSDTPQYVMRFFKIEDPGFGRTVAGAFVAGTVPAKKLTGGAHRWHSGLGQTYTRAGDMVYNTAGNPLGRKAEYLQDNRLRTHFKNIAYGIFGK